MLRELLVKKKSAIVDKWVQRILGSYPSESLKFLISQKDRFANPVGYTISSSAGAIFDELIGDSDSRVTETLLKDVVRIRAVQEFSPSQAIRFVFDLKEVIRNEIEKEAGEICSSDELAELESRIDNLALIAFDSYMDSREKLFRIRLDEVKARSRQSTAENGDIRNDEHVKRDG
ncbi:MAG: RsbRD N-terminal domain-containing protein [Bacteroidetes bacterium]|nr:RsbRD N-terminal domain-containing protein [Bacteroidota bacterium]